MQATNPALMEARKARSRRLLQELIAAIRQRGPMPFVEFMRAALYAPEHGYYTAPDDPWSDTPDFVTVPQVDGALGRAVASLAAAVDEAAGLPSSFALVEVGSGAGALVGSVAVELSRRFPETARRTTIWSVERGAGARSRQAAALRDVDVRVVATLEELPEALVGLVYANELFDAFPVCRLRRGDALLEAHVDVAASELVERWLPLATAGVTEHLLANDIALRDGQIGEVCLGVREWIEKLDTHLHTGALLAIDYGHETAALYDDNRHQGTLVSQSRFRLSDDLLREPGGRDLTAHVDFGNLRRLALGLGFGGGELCSLRVLLVGAAIAGSDAPRPATPGLRHLLVDPVADLHRAMLLTRRIDAARLPFGRRALEREAGEDTPC